MCVVALATQRFLRKYDVHQVSLYVLNELVTNCEAINCSQLLP
jgi:hypothetical protein